MRFIKCIVIRKENTIGYTISTSVVIGTFVGDVEYTGLKNVSVLKNSWYMMI
jgi:hypothetical protein